MPGSLLWTEKFAPGDLGGFVGNAESMNAAKIWALNWQRGQKQKPLLFFGPTGVGKTMLAGLLAKELEWELFELNASDFRTKDIIDRVAGAASLNSSFSGKKRLVLLDEVDGVHGKQDKGGMQAIASLLREAQQPVILTANSIYADKKMAGVRGIAGKVEFKRPRYTEIARFLQGVCDSEGIDYDLSSVNAIAKNANGDIRSALLDLQSIAEHTRKLTLGDVEESGFRERQTRVFEVLQKVFHAKTVKDCQAVRRTADISSDMLFLWIEENIPRHFTKRPDTENAFDMLSRADVFNGRIYRRQNYGFLRYSSELMTSGVAIPRQNSYPGFVGYRFPGILSSLSASMAERGKRKETAMGMKKKVRGSAKKIASSDMPYYKIMFEDRKTALETAFSLGLDAGAVSFLLGQKPDSKKTKAFMEEIQKMRQKGAERQGGSKKLSPMRKDRETPVQNPLEGEKDREKDREKNREKDREKDGEKDREKDGEKDGEKGSQTRLFGF